MLIFPYMTKLNWARHEISTPIQRLNSLEISLYIKYITRICSYVPTYKGYLYIKRLLNAPQIESVELAILLNIVERVGRPTS